MSRETTPSEVKWLVNALAAARGDLARIEDEVLEARARLDRLTAARSQQVTLCASLEEVLKLTSQVPPEAETCVVFVHKNYGRRGSLKRWLIDELKAQYPKALTGMELLALAEPRFGLSFSTSQAREAYYNNTFRRQLKCFAQEGLLERIAVREGQVQARWRWAAGPSLDSLRAAAAREHG